jgi:hypothetical protein
MFKVNSRHFLEELSRRRQQFAQPTVAFRIVVPPEHRWWYWNEFGTATHAERGTANPTGYKIPDPSKPGSEWQGKLLLIPIGGKNSGEYKIVPEVWHPGISPKHFITTRLPEIHAVVQEHVAKALLTGGFNLEFLRHILATRTMPTIKAAIVESISENLEQDGVRDDPYARLEGEPASMVFDAVSNIIEV